MITFAITMSATFSKAMSGVITSTNDFLTSSSVAIFNIPNKYVSTSSIRFYHFMFSFYEYSFFISSVFYNIFNVNSVTNILNNDFYITYLFDRNNRFLYMQLQSDRGVHKHISSEKK